MKVKKSHGECPVCKWPVKQGTPHKVKGIRRWYHNSCYLKLKPAKVEARSEEHV